MYFEVYSYYYELRSTIIVPNRKAQFQIETLD